MTTINEIFRTFSPEYLERFGGRIPKEHIKVINAILNCRTKEAGTAIYECERCGKLHLVYQSCGNRHCPNCQHYKTRLWLEDQMKKRLPGHHFMITFTVPDKIRSFIRSHQEVSYSAMFKASAESIKKLTVDSKYMGGDLPGFFSVLHTWGRTLVYHPHIHCVVVGGALSKDNNSWHPSRVDFYVPVKALSKIFKAKFRDEMKKENLFDKIPAQVWKLNWNVNCQAVGSNEASIKYLAPYVFKVAISNNRIVKVENRTVFIRYKKPHSQRWRTLHLDAFEFIRRFLQHVLPSGFMKIRYYGFLHPNCNVSIDKIKTLIELAYGFKPPIPEVELTPWQPILCQFCGGTLKLHALHLPCGIIVRPG